MTFERVRPIEGARVVDFDYAAAEEAWTWAIRTMPRTVGEQVEVWDPAVAGVVGDWDGEFRRQFDGAATNLRFRLTTASGYGDLTVSDAVTTAVAEANRLQGVYNDAAEAAATDPPTGPGPN